ncbi:MAG TPA: Ku protein [Burkholderiales bacterium]|jgi:DNA end-binding protein Ku|nr:Ku protein [Burkholderiales bacterium]
MARGLWKGAISFGLVNVPVELFSAEKRSSELDLTMLDKRDLAPVGYKRYNKSTGEDVPWPEIVKGYEYEDDKYVVLSEEDFRRANVDASKTVDIQAFVDLKDIPPLYFETPYYLAPGKRGEKAYALLRDAMKKAGKAGIATVVIRTRQYLAAVLPQDDVLLMDTLRYADEIRAPDELGVPNGALHHKASPKEIDMALRMIDDMSEKWRPEKFKDTYRDDLLARIKDKIKQGQTEEITQPEKGEKAPAKAEVIDLMALLKKSVEKKQDKPKRAKRAHRAKRRAA